MENKLKEESIEDFLSYMGQIKSLSLVGHGIGLGSALGIFDVMSEFCEPKTCEEIAQAGKWKPRYITEWLGLMTCGKIVNYNADSKTYYIPKHRQNVLSQKGKGISHAVLLQGSQIATQAIQELESCCKLDGPRGIPYISYKGYHEWRNGWTQIKYTLDVIKDILTLSEGLLQKLEQGVHVIDGGCSLGNQVLLLAEEFPNSTFLGFDIDSGAVNTANELARQKGLKNITFEVQDGCNMPQNWSNFTDLFMVWDVVHDVPYPKKFLEEIYRVLKPGGMFFMSDVNVHSDLGKNLEIPSAVVPYGVSLFHCLPISLYFEGGEGLGAAWGIEKQEEYLKDAGFSNISLLPAKDVAHSFFASYKSK